MPSTKILIVEDQVISAKSMRITLEKNGYVVTAIAATSEQAISSVKEDLPDLVLMDIELKGKIDGISTARTIQRQYDLPVIFITQREDDETFLNAKEISPQNYLNKPFTDRTLLNAVALAVHNLKKKAEHITDSEANTAAIFIPQSDKFKQKLILSDILYIKAEGAYSNIFFEQSDKQHASSGKEAYHKVSLSSNKLVQQLNYPSIIKVHRSYYVNVNKVDKVGNHVLMIKDKEIPIGPEYNNQVLKKNIRSIRHD